MKEIKSRGLTKEGKWVYGCLVEFEDMSIIFENSVLITKSSSLPYSYIASDFWVEVIPETVGQYTGLKDKNDKEIFEGDIIKLAENTYGETESPISCVVKWNDKGFYQLWRNGIIHWKIWREDAYYNTGYRKDWKVIGNIHENLNLLETK